MPAVKTPGVFCLEGDWSPRLTDESSIRPTLDLLRQYGQIKFIYRDVATPAEFEHYINKWLQRQYDAYWVGQISLHGEPGGFWVGKDWYGLGELEELLAGRCEGRVLYFGSCATLDIPDEEIESFRRRTKARAVCGYTEDVDWLKSAAFEMLVLEAVTSYKRIDAGFKWLEKDVGELTESLGFKASWKQR